jgi:hypothetical protein
MNFRLSVPKLLIAIATFVLCGMFPHAAHGQQIMRGQICDGAARTTSDSSKAGVDCKIDKLKRGDHFVFVSSQDQSVYQIDGGKKTKPFAGMNVVVIGSVDRRAGTINITDIYQALSPVVTRAKTIFIDCDACPRAMASAWRAAFEALSDWGRFDILPDPMHADLILIVSANPYLGDYTTRDGPDQRPVHIQTTYMNVVDPHTGASLWGDSKELGSWLVPRSTKDLVNEFREQLKLEESIPKT